MSYNLITHFPYSPVKIAFGLVMALAVSYIGLIAVVMSYAAHTVEFSQSVRNDETAVAMLEGEYLATMARISKTDYVAAGYAEPSAKIFVPAKSVTALR
ncbi:MAG: hypothetical protein Q7J45_01155 [bacterium]|nr:hypothetical protein [bacterium]